MDIRITVMMGRRREARRVVMGMRQAAAHIPLWYDRQDYMNKLLVNICLGLHLKMSFLPHNKWCFELWWKIHLSGSSGGKLLWMYFKVNVFCHRMLNSFYMLFEHKCVLEVCVHIHPIIKKNPPSILFVSMSPFYLRPALSELSSVHHCVYSGAGEDKMSLIKWLRCFVVGCNNEHSSRHLFQTSELLKMGFF